jgi:hypothetical protein
MGFNFVSILFSAIALLFITLFAFIGASKIDTETDVSTDTPLNSNISIRLTSIDDQIFTHLTNASITTTIQPTANDNLKEKSDDMEKITFKKSVNEKGVKLFRWSRERDFRFPIRPPKLKKVNETEKTIEKARIGYASVLQIRQTNPNTTVTPMHTTVKKFNRKRLSNANQKNLDVFEISSSDHSPSIAIFVPKRTSKKIFTRRVIIGTNNTIKRIPKLLLPKHLRPAMYSLDGFVPRPSINKITSTEAPTTTKSIRFSSRRIRNKKSKTESNSNKIKRFGGNKVETQINEKVDDIEVSDSRRRNIVTKRKGILTAAASQQKPTVNRILQNKRKGLPGKDYPTLNSVPKTGFDCSELNNGVYADMETGCQVWHICQNRQKHSFLCPNGTIFNEKNSICDWWYNYDCPQLVRLGLKDEDSLNSKKETESLILKKAKSRRFGSA